jgi:peptidoglycan/xylan/chitin deacetylase (PgdA/CDA1 family)
MSQNVISSTEIYDDGRFAMNEFELIQLINNNNVVGSHTLSHYRFDKNDSVLKLREEINDSKTQLEIITKQHVSSFCWVGGESEHYTNYAHSMIKETGYLYSFMTNSFPIKFNTDRLQIQRTNIESSFSFAHTLFCISGFYDLLYYWKRIKVNKIFSQSKFCMCF